MSVPSTGLSDWSDPSYFQRGLQADHSLWSLMVKQVMPGKRQRTLLTTTGWMLILVALGIGTAAYQTSSNILFLVLSILLSSLILSGILSVINFRGLQWRLRVPPRIRAGGVGVVQIEVTNCKRVFPTMSIWYSIRTCDMEDSESLYMRDGLAAGASRKMEWPFHPKRRGVCSVQICSIDSQYPFGFLRRHIGRQMESELLVWPARVEYDFNPVAGGRRHLMGATHRRIGQGTDLVSLRNYHQGDPPRLIHWKATAREGRIMIRQLVDESEDGYTVIFRSHFPAMGAEQFETLCSLACSVTEDLFLSGRLQTTLVDEQPPRSIRTKEDLHEFFDQLASAEPVDDFASTPQAGDHQITFRPVGKTGVHIYVGEQQAGEAKLS